MNRLPKKSKVGMKEIAELAGMSVMTVSRVLSGKDCCSDDTSKKIKSIAEKLGYFPNMLGRSLVMDRFNTVGVLIPNIIHEFFPRVVNSIEETLALAGYNTFLCCSHDDPEIEAAKARNLLSYRVAGVIMMPSLRSQLSHQTASTIGRRCPLVLVDRIIDSIKTDSVGWRSEDAMGEIVNHLVSSGRRRIAYLCGEKPEWEKRGRTRGFFRAMRANKLECFAHEYCASGEVAKIVKNLFSKKTHPDAICCATDIIASEVLEALDALKIKVPEQTALTGFGGVINTHNSKLRVTTAVQNAEEMGEAAAKLILKRIEDIESGKNCRPKKILMPLDVKFYESSKGA